MKRAIQFGILGLTIFIMLFVYSRKINVGTKRGNQNNTNLNAFKNGDIIFQTSLSEQSKAIQLATGSVYSHCGIIFKEGENYFVFEAIQPVTKTPLANWIARGKNKHYIVKRLKNSDNLLAESVIAKMKQEAKQYIGKNYDLTFEWSDERIYCSELIWKIYKQAIGIEIGKLETIANLDLSSQIVKQSMKARYGNKIPTEEIVITPKAIFESDKLETIINN